ncbi:MAG: LamG domain-containing protein [Kiritimatiellia bacterium]
MRAKLYGVVCGSLLSILSNQASGTNLAVQAAVALRLSVDLVDGSRLIGTPAIETVPVETSYAKMNVPLKQIRMLKIGEDHETVTLDLRNGDKLKGVITLGPIKLQTVFGPVAIGTAHLRELRVLLSGGALPEALQKGLVLHYSFDRDEGGKVTDGSEKANHGTVRGARFTPEGKSGGAMSFNGVDDFLDAGNPPSLQLTSDFTLAAWIWPERTQDSFGIITKSHGYPEQARRGIEFMIGHDDTLSAYFWDASTRYFSGVVKNQTIRRQEWTHVVLQHDSTLPQHQMRFFINGVACEAGFGYEVVSSIPVLRNVDEPVRIGCMRPGVHHFKGRIDHVMIFNRTLSKDEVQTLYDAQK